MLACPRCHGALEDATDLPAQNTGSRASGDIIGLRCPACRVTYPIEDGIPVLLIAAADESANAGS